MASLGTIPDFATARLYAVVVVTTRDDPRLLALWCHYAFWQPIDAALGQTADMTTWAERSALAPEIVATLTQTLITRGLLTAQGTISWWNLEQASRSVVLPYSNILRQRAGGVPYQPTQEALFAPDCEGAS